jgi:imidazoleglycerol-phosphate dehydratase/histidinol-phosphatase
MLEQLAAHGGFSLTVRAVGDIQVDSHHTVEDVAIVLGETLRESLGSKLGIRRYGFVLPMDESQSTISLDLSGRGAFVFECKFPGERIGDFPVEMISHFFGTLSAGLGAAIHMQTKGENSHHMAESIFKGFGRSLRQAVELIRQESLVLPSTKGVL